MSKLSDKRAQFFMVEDAVFDFNLTPYEGWVYMAILKHADRQTGIAFPGIGRLSKLTQMSKDQVMRCIKSLEEKGIIAVTRDAVIQKGEKRQRGVNHYEVKPLTGNASQQLGGVVADSDYGSSQEPLGVVATSNMNQNHSNHNQLTGSKPPAKQSTGSKPLHDQLIDVWAHETKYMGDGYNNRWAAKRLLELEPPATIGEVETVCRLKMPGRKTEYDFKYLLDDIPHRRAQLAKQAEDDTRKAAVTAKVDATRRANRILLGWESGVDEVVSDAS